MQAALLTQPFDFRAAAARLQASCSTSAPTARNTASSRVLARPQWLRENPDAARGYLRALSDAVDWLYDPANRDEAIAILARGHQARPGDRRRRPTTTTSRSCSRSAASSRFRTRSSPSTVKTLIELGDIKPDGDVDEVCRPELPAPLSSAIARRASRAILMACGTVRRRTNPGSAMPDLPLTLAIGDYLHTRELTTGRVKPEGIELTVLNHPFETIAYRFLATYEWEMSEFSLATYCTLLRRGRCADDRRCRCSRRGCSGTARSSCGANSPIEDRRRPRGQADRHPAMDADRGDLCARLAAARRRRAAHVDRLGAGRRQRSPAARRWRSSRCRRASG